MIALDRPGFADAVGRLVLGNRAVSSAARLLTRRRLRILAYHGVTSKEAFDRQLDLITSSYTVVSGAAVADALRGDRRLPADAVWLTFDDGRADVVELALPLLGRRGVPATLFACPGLAERASPPWWEVIAAGDHLGLTPPGFTSGGPTVTELKTWPDVERRALVEEVREQLSDEVLATLPRTAGVDELRSWLDAGLEIGNHTWDHPCLDRSLPAEQEDQIVRAHDRLDGLGAFEDVKLFAYPNGDWTLEAEAVLTKLDYDLALLFDHKLARTSCNPLRLSRLRIDADAEDARVRAVVSGAHSFVFGAVQAVRRR